jgi:hypothetical protein
MAAVAIASDICYEHIFKSYWYAKYGTFTVIIHKELGYVNATQLCKAHDKQFYNWYANKGVKTMVQALAARQTPPIVAEQMMITVKGGSGAHAKIVAGSYVHPVLIPHIMSWMDAAFANVVSDMINGLYGLKGDVGAEVDIKAIMQGDASAKKLTIKKCVVPASLRKSFMIYTRNDPKFPYQAIEVMVKGVNAAIKRFQKTPAGTDTQVLLEIKNIPDVVSLFSMIKSSGLIQTNKQAFTSRLPRELLIEKIKELSWSNVTQEAWVQAILKSDLAMSDDSESGEDSDITDNEEASDGICK